VEEERESTSTLRLRGGREGKHVNFAFALRKRGKARQLGVVRGGGEGKHVNFASAWKRGLARQFSGSTFDLEYKV
jgi:hypothetical protein